jgi:hypothetical protein
MSSASQVQEFIMAPPLAGKRSYPKPGVSATADFVLGSLPGEFEGAFAAGSIHVIAGASGTGKTSIALPMLIAQRAGLPVFGRETFSKSFIAVMGDRGEGETKRTLARLKIVPDFPIISLSGEQHATPIAPLVEQLYLENGRPDIVFLEGLDLLMKNQLKMDSAAPNLAYLREVATHYHFSLICTAGCPKQRGKDKYEAGSRDQIFGSVAFSRMTDTILLLSSDAATHQTTAYFQFRNSASVKQVLAWEDGRLVPYVSPPPEPDAFESWVMAQSEPFTTEAAAEANQMHAKRARRRLQGMNLVPVRSGKRSVWTVRGI